MLFIEVAVSEVESRLINFANVTQVYQTPTGSMIRFVDGKKLAVIHETGALFALILGA
jgi:hypothetical protein